MEQQGCQVIDASCMIGDIAKTICDYASQMNIDQIIVGSHGRTGLAKLLMGSVSSEVLEKCKCPVTIHRVK
jgi:nucleotide-binding universal stress UspA family protein